MKYINLLLAADLLADHYVAGEMNARSRSAYSVMALSGNFTRKEIIRFAWLLYELVYDEPNYNEARHHVNNVIMRCNYGYPIKTYSDLCREYGNEVAEQFCKLLGIHIGNLRMKEELRRVKSDKLKTHCPVCLRSVQKLKELKIPHVIHHDHMDEYMEPRFQPIVVCSVCNQIDSTFKKWAKRNGFRVIDGFSFSPQEMTQLITKVKDKHAKHEIDYDKALKIYQEWYDKNFSEEGENKNAA
jgi:protein-arginine kinase activator protein McsA